MQLERCAPPSVWAPLHRMAADMSVCRLCFRQASTLVATDVDEQPIAQATRTTHFEDENSTAMEVGDAESLGLGEPVGGVADLENAAAEASPALTLAVVQSLATGMFAVGPDAPMAEVRRSRSRWPQLRSPCSSRRPSARLVERSRRQDLPQPGAPRPLAHPHRSRRSAGSLAAFVAAASPPLPPSSPPRAEPSPSPPP